jgi:hypothetical protein
VLVATIDVQLYLAIPSLRHDHMETLTITGESETVANNKKNKASFGKPQI